MANIVDAGLRQVRRAVLLINAEPASTLPSTRRPRSRCRLRLQDLQHPGLIGLLGSDDFSFKVSPDGAAYHDALLIDRTSGRVELPKPAILPAASSAPAAPASGKLALYARSRAGQPWLDAMRANGRDFSPQPHLGLARPAVWLPSVWVRVVDEVSGAVFEQEITTDLPAITQFLAPRLFMNKGPRLPPSPSTAPASTSRPTSDDACGGPTGDAATAATLHLIRAGGLHP